MTDGLDPHVCWLVVGLMHQSVHYLFAGWCTHWSIDCIECIDWLAGQFLLCLSLPFLTLMRQQEEEEEEEEEEGLYMHRLHDSV